MVLNAGTFVWDLFFQVEVAFQVSLISVSLSALKFSLETTGDYVFFFINTLSKALK